MLPLWRLTRNRYGRALYEALAARGISATKMYRYEGRIDAAPPARDPPADVAVDAVLDAVRRGRTAARGRLSPKRSTCASTPGTRIWASARCCDR